MAAVLGRFAGSLGVLVTVSIILFALVHAIPVSPARVVLVVAVVFAWVGWRWGGVCMCGGGGVGDRTGMCGVVYVVRR